jgi:hypothetical protein
VPPVQNRAIRDVAKLTDAAPGALPEAWAIGSLDARATSHVIAAEVRMRLGIIACSAERDVEIA